MFGGHSGRSGSRLLPVLGASVLALSLAPSALAAVEKGGEWPAEEKKVTLDVERVSREEAIKRLAAAAGWSIVVHAPSADPVDIHVKDQPADKVLALLLDDADYTAKRDGNLLSIARAHAPAVAAAPVGAVPPVPPVPPVPEVAPAPPVPPAPPAPPAPPVAMKRQGKDREVVAQNLVIEKGEIVRDVHVAGGSLEVRGTVTGDVEVVGGRVTVDNGAQVMGDVQVMGGSVLVKNGGRVDGDAQIVGGKLEREEGAIVSGDVSANAEEEQHEHEESVSTTAHMLSETGEAITGGALLFALGAVLLALFTKRAETLKVEVAARPMRSFALGIVGTFGALALLVALSVTVIGIPVAVIALLLGTFGVFAAMCSVLEVAGKAVIGHKTKNEYVHLAFGCGMFLLAGALPWLGGLVKAAVVLTAIGTLVATRAAGFIPPKKGSGNMGSDAHPYRSADAI